MNVLSLATLRTFWEEHPDAEAPLRRWHKHVRSASYGSYADVKADFGSADWVKGFLVFDIAGNKYRIIVYPAFAFSRFYIKHVFTHAEYDLWRA